MPLAVETLVGCRPIAGAQIKKIGSALALHLGQLEGETTSFAWRRLGILQKGNCVILGNCTPMFPSPDIDVVL